LELERSGPTRAALRALRVLETFMLLLPDGSRIAIEHYIEMLEDVTVLLIRERQQSRLAG
jgi:hypothetical protein